MALDDRSGKNRAAVLVSKTAYPKAVYRCYSQSEFKLLRYGPLGCPGSIVESRVPVHSVAPPRPNLVASERADTIPNGLRSTVRICLILKTIGIHLCWRPWLPSVSPDPRNLSVELRSRDSAKPMERLNQKGHLCLNYREIHVPNPYVLHWWNTAPGGALRTNDSGKESRTSAGEHRP